MKFVWGKTQNQLNQRLEFDLFLEKQCDTLELCAVDFYQVYFDGNLVSYGPSRTAMGYSRKRIFSLNGVKQILIKVAHYNANCYACDRQAPFFGASVLKDGKVIYSTKDFKCRQNLSVVTDLPRYSGQRGYTERFDLTNNTSTEICTYSVKKPKILGGGEDYANYQKISFSEGSSGEFNGFSQINNSKLSCDRFESGFSVKDEIIERCWEGYNFIDYTLSSERTGFFTFIGKTDKETELFIFFEEILVDGVWQFRRSGCNDFITIKLPKGEFDITTFEPYSSKILKIVSKDIPKELSVKMITLENKNADKILDFNDEKLNAIYLSAQNTFKQNAVDIFTDCPSRERAGWLCDSYFLGIAENFYCNNNQIESNFLENYVLSKTSEIPKGMLAKCFPSQHPENSFIPNWALWFIVELNGYFNRTNDAKMVKRAKKKVYDLLKYFSKYENEFGLLENLDGWIFVEWSDCNLPDHVCGVNYSTNMLYSFALSCVGKLYKDKKQLKKANLIKQSVVEQSFDGQFFCDNSIRKDGKLVPNTNNLTETCQYYALFFDIINDKDFEQKIIKEFGPRSANNYPNVSKSNVFIGNYLRFLWLLRKNEHNKIIDECVDYFYQMAVKTGTLWEHDTPHASCNHGFASVLGKIIFDCKGNYGA